SRTNVFNHSLLSIWAASVTFCPDLRPCASASDTRLVSVSRFFDEYRCMNIVASNMRQTVVSVADFWIWMFLCVLQLHTHSWVNIDSGAPVVTFHCARGYDIHSIALP
ncbi:hypothetical protein BJ912DRAFT_982038, partial [Pholiota molesta]